MRSSRVAHGHSSMIGCLGPARGRPVARFHWPRRALAGLAGWQQDHLPFVHTSKVLKHPRTVSPRLEVATVKHQFSSRGWAARTAVIPWFA